MFQCIQSVVSNAELRVVAICHVIRPAADRNRFSTIRLSSSRDFQREVNNDGPLGASGMPVDFSENEEQSMIREMVRGFAEEVLSPTTLERDKEQRAPLEEWKSFCEYGLQGITIPEEYGGSPVDDITEAIIVE